jgi:hypothetical protein
VVGVGAGARRPTAIGSCFVTGGDFGCARVGRSLWHLDTIDHFFVMVGQVLDSALIGGVVVRLTLSDGGVVEGVPGAPASDVPAGEELDDSGYMRWISLSGTSVDLADVRQATIVHPASRA